jgi:hypothetical protein
MVVINSCNRVFDRVFHSHGGVNSTAVLTTSPLHLCANTDTRYPLFWRHACLRYHKKQFTCEGQGLRVCESRFLPALGAQ